MPVHCQIEAISAASLFACVDDTDCSAPADGGCSEDFCGSVESGNYFPQKSADLAKAPLAPLEFELFSAAALNFVPLERSLTGAEENAPLCAPSWHFAQRAVASPRAPSLVS